ncbi:MAG: permease [Candidatus Contubernalis sp.]|nr:permease [Candidatus Contubernalis sp.]
MTNALVVLSLIAIILLFVAYRQGKHVEGLKEAKRMFLNVLPLLLFAFIIVGFIDILIPKEALQAWLGEESGWKGLIIGPAIGALIQGGPFAFFPLFNTVFRDSVTTGTAVAMITAWGMINIGHLPYEFTFLGPRFVALKYSIYIAIPSLAGLLANLLFR